MSREELPSWIKPDLWLDESRAVEFTTHQGAAGPTGAHFVHRNKQKPDEWCIGGFQWTGTTGPNWTLVSLSPLHVEPSIHCLSCGEHGYIRGGRWLPA